MTLWEFIMAILFGPEVTEWEYASTYVYFGSDND